MSHDYTDEGLFLEPKTQSLPEGIRLCNVHTMT